MELISREKLLSYLQSEVHFWKDEDEKVYKVVDIIKFEIEELPIIESRPKGEFEYLGESKRKTYVDMYKCSNCDFVSLSLGNDFLNYCPNCGADMRGEE